MGAGMPSGTMPSFNFLLDEPASVDAFGAKRIAEAIATAISGNPKLKVIGLIGPWGSGKSTVVSFLGERLAQQPSITSHIFTYDAWLHQSDPPRRAFLEDLIHFLINADGDLAKREDWTLQLDRLNGRIEDTLVTKTPVLTPNGTFVILSLLAVPIGSALVMKSGIENAIHNLRTLSPQFLTGIGLLAVPLLVALWVYWCWRPARWPWQREFWTIANLTRHRAPHQEESILSMFIQKETTNHKNRITRDPVPTAIEFQTIFRTIMHSVARSDRRFVFVVDNLDRLPAVEAIEMWSTIRSFFLGADNSTVGAPMLELPTVILPMDEEALLSIYANGAGDDDAKARTNAFMEKTFDLTLRLTRPVFTDWRDFLESQMQKVFGDVLGKDWARRTGLFLDQQFLLNRATPITPRRINTLINTIAVTWMQWHDSDIPFSSVAYYCVFQPSIDRDIFTELAQPKASVDRYDADWQRSMAAMHYGVAPNIAYQVLLETPLRTAISERSGDDFNELLEKPGFAGVFHRLVQGYRDNDATTPEAVISTINLLAGMGADAADTYAEEWNLLREALIRSRAWPSFTAADCAAVEALLDRGTEAENRETFASAQAHINVSAAAPGPGIAEIIATFLMAVDDHHPNLIQQDLDITLPDSPETFAVVAALCKDRPRILDRLRSRATASDIAKVLESDFAAPYDKSIEQRFRGVFATTHRIESEAYFNAAGQLLASASGGNAATALLALGVGARDNVAAAKAQVAALVGNGRLAIIVAETWASNSIESFARSAALLIILQPSAFPALDTTLAARSLVFPDIPRQVDEALREFGAPAKVSFEALVDLATANAPIQSPVSEVLRHRVDQGTLDGLSPLGFLERFSALGTLVPAETLTNLVVAFADDESFWADLSRRPLPGVALSVLSILVDQDASMQSRAASVLFDALGRISDEQWSAAIAAPNEISAGAHVLAQSSNTTSQLPRLTVPLTSAIEQALTSSVSEWLERYFFLIFFLPSAEKQTLLRTLRDRILSTNPLPNLSRLLAAGGSVLLTEGHFNEKADEVTRRILTTVFNESDGPAYLRVHAQDLAGLVAGSAEESREVVRGRLHEMANGTNPDHQELAGLLATSWHFDLSPPGDEMQDATPGGVAE